MGSKAGDGRFQTPEEAHSQPSERFVEVYDELRSLAERHLHEQRPDHTLQPTALVHEAYLRLAQGTKAEGIDQLDLLRLAARAMRSVLVDHARRRKAMKRKGTGHRVSLDAVAAVYGRSAIDLVALDDALTKLAELEPQWATLIELRFFGGCTEEETAELLKVSSRTVRRQWRGARAWLRNQIDGGKQDGS
jgi:RNA polymerase sigma-70 factor (ECF subfamily)